jgi:hypothetical protein
LGIGGLGFLIHAIAAAVFLRLYYPDRPYDELARAVFVVSSLIRGSAAALPTVDALGKRADYVDDITLATEQYIRARLGTPVEPSPADSVAASPRP